MNYQSGVSVGYADLCQHQKKTNVVEKRTCVTSYELFQNICIDREVLKVAIRATCDIRVEEPDYTSNSFRKAAYRQFILWRFDKLGRGNRKVCPACTVRIVRDMISQRLDINALTGVSCY